MLAVVVNTAARTNFHTVVALVATAELERRSHFQEMVVRIGNFLILITVVLVVTIVMVSLFRQEHFLEIARFALVLTVAAIPVALPAVLSVTMAVGAVNLARRRAIVSRLTAIEELAGVDVFCSDKTGTLTTNEMRVAEPVALSGHDERELSLVAALASKPENRDRLRANERSEDGGDHQRRGRQGGPDHPGPRHVSRHACGSQDGEGRGLGDSRPPVVPGEPGREDRAEG